MQAPLRLPAVRSGPSRELNVESSLNLEWLVDVLLRDLVPIAAVAVDAQRGTCEPLALNFDAGDE